MDGAAIGSLMSPILANLFKENFEVKALSTASNHTGLWRRYVDDTFVVQKASSEPVPRGYQLT